MYLAKPEMIKKIDSYAANVLGIPTDVLVDRAGEAVAKAVRSKIPSRSKVAFLCGGGNNGADGVSAAVKLRCEYDVTVIICSRKIKSDTGVRLIDKFVSEGGKIIEYYSKDSDAVICDSDCIVDAVFGTGYNGELDGDMLTLSRVINKSCAYKIAVDVPLGVNPGKGSVHPDAVRADLTVQLSFIKTGTVSYPAKEYMGDVLLESIGLDCPEILNNFSFDTCLTDEQFADLTLPCRSENSNKGTFGKLFMIAGSDKYKGAAKLCLEAAMRAGVGLVKFAGEKSVVDMLIPVLPEALYTVKKKNEEMRREDVTEISACARGFDAIVLGCGCGNSPELFSLVRELLLSFPAPVMVLDADALNSIASAGEDGKRLMRTSQAKLILTPHPLEFSRLCGAGVENIQNERLPYAENYARENNCVLVLKGAGTIITDGNKTYINSTGSSALAKGGSGDVLAGVIASFAAQKIPPLEAAALAVYYHGLAADVLAEKYSRFGVIPSDLPIAIASCMSRTEKKHLIKNATL